MFEINEGLYPGTVLRSVMPKDIPALMKLERSVRDCEGFNRWISPRWIHEITANNIWGIEQNGNMIYVVGFVHKKPEHVIDVIKLTAGAVGQPLTARLIQVGGVVLRKAGIESIRGRCAKRLLEFYQKHDFKVIGVLPHYFGPDVEGYGIERRIVA